MNVSQFINSDFNSNTYVLSSQFKKDLWLIDVGVLDEIMTSYSDYYTIKGVFVTHPHFDHIYRLNKLIELFPLCKVFSSDHGMKGLYSDKLNLSFYHEDPIIFNGPIVNILHENDKVELFEGCFLETLETPGHNWGCLTYKVDDYIFTGDSFIPNIKVVTKLKGGDKEANKISLKKISDNISDNTIICPGHGEMIHINT
jgi:hydroxyacylglutathione hydrolase